MKQIIILVIAVLFLSGCTLSEQQEVNKIDTLTPNNNASLSLGSDKLDLSSEQLKKIPENIFNQASLEELDISI